MEKRILSGILTVFCLVLSTETFARSPLDERSLRYDGAQMWGIKLTKDQPTTEVKSDLKEYFGLY